MKNCRATVLAGTTLLISNSIAQGQSQTGNLASHPVIESNSEMPTALQRDPPSDPNRFRLDFSAAFNIKGGFANPRQLTSGPNRQITPDGKPYNYDDGYVLTDVSGNAGGQTWNWGYNSPGQISGNTVLMHRATALSEFATGMDQTSADPSLGFELAYDRELGRYQALHYGMEVGINYLRVSLNSNRQGPASITQTTDAYSFNPGVSPPGAPYQGTFNGPGFLINSSPDSSTSATSMAMIADHQQLDADVWGWRLGPYVDYPLTDYVRVSLSGGLAMAVFDISGSWTETVNTSGSVLSASGSGSDTSFQWGAYAGLDVTWRLSSHWDAETGLQYQYLNDYRHVLGGRAAELDLGQSIIITLGLNYKF